MSSTNKNNFISPFQIWMLFISFSCLIGVVGLPILCGIEMTVMSILVLFPTSEERTLTFYFQVVVSFGLVLYGVYYVKITFLLNLLSKAEVLSHKLPIFFFFKPVVFNMSFCLSISSDFSVITYIQLNSVHFSHSVVSDSLRPHESQHARPPCPSPTPGVYSNPCSSSW